MKLSVVIISWNTKNLLEHCLESVADDLQQIAITNKLKAEIIVVDNGSTDGSVEMIKKLLITNYQSPATLHLIENKENLGFSKANNQGIKVASGEYIMLLNSDTIVKDGAIGKLVCLLDSRRDFDIVGPRLLNNDNSFQANCGRFPRLPVAFVMLFKEHYGGSDFVRCSPKESGEIDWLMGAAFMARKKVFEEIGGLDENIFMYMEEVEWFYRAKKTGFKAFFLKEAEIVHLGRGSSKSGKTEPILNIYKGLLYFYKKHLSMSEILILEGMLKLKALLALGLGYTKGDNYLKETYGKAIKIH